MIAALFLVVGAAFLTQVVPYRQIIDSNQGVEDARAHLAALEAENKLLGADVVALGTDNEIEKLAREKLGYVRPGEVAFVVVDPPPSAATPVVEEVEEEFEDSKTWVDRIWDFLTGADTGGESDDQSGG